MSNCLQSCIFTSAIMHLKDACFLTIFLAKTAYSIRSAYKSMKCLGKDSIKKLETPLPPSFFSHLHIYIPVAKRYFRIKNFNYT